MPRSLPIGRLLLVGVIVVVSAIDPPRPRPVAAGTPPDPPIIASPQPTDVAPEDVHMEFGAPFRDADGDAHQATDWEIRSADGSSVVWAAYSSSELVHAHFDDGVFIGPLAGQRQLAFSTTYLFRARVQDSSGDWSDWTERLFRTRPQLTMQFRRVTGLLVRPAPTWLSDGGTPISLPIAADLIFETAERVMLLTLRGVDGGLEASGGGVSPPNLLRLRLTASADEGVTLPTSRLRVVTDAAERLTIYLPAVTVAAGQELALWVTETGATFYGRADETHPKRDRLARDVAIPWQVEPGYRVEAISGAFQMPASLAFVETPGREPTAPRFYVTELDGRIKVVANDGRVFNVAQNLLNFNPVRAFPGSGELGVIGVCLQPGSHDVYFTTVFRDSGGSLRNRLMRIRSSDGLTGTAVETVLAVRPGEGLSRYSHQIQQCSFGPDGKLYTFMADGTDPSNAQDDSAFGGKVLRLNPDGSAPADNPHFDPQNPAAPISYQFTKGHRNAYGMTWRPSDGHLYLTENGPDVDRIVRIEPGRNYGWDGTNDSMRTNALYVWPEAHWSPVGLVFVEGPAAGALPPDKQGRLLVASAGTVYGGGPQPTGKAIQEFRVHPDGTFGDPTIFLRYIGEGRSSMVDLKLQPDGLYFTNLYLDDGDGGASAPGGQVWRIRYTGSPTIAPSAAAGPAPLTVAFTSSAASGAVVWDFGDGDGADGPAPTHTFAAPGRYAVLLTATAPDGTTAESLALITVTAADGTVPSPPPTTARLAAPPAPDAVFFPETGVLLGGGFKYFWETRGGLTTFGYPLTQELREVNPADGQVYTVQYFERARFEYHPEHRGTPYETQLGLLGRQATGRRADEPPFQPLATPPDGARYVPETGHSLDGPFRARWETAGGADIFGLPISEPFSEESLTDGKEYTVQYFERARFEYHPEWGGTVNEVRLARLGTAQVARRPPPRLPTGQ